MDKGKNTVTLHDINNEIVKEQYYVFPGTTVTVCCLTLRNGFFVTGNGACVDPNMFDEEKGRALALCDAKNKMWPLLAFRLKDEEESNELH